MKCFALILLLIKLYLDSTGSINQESLKLIEGIGHLVNLKPTKISSVEEDILYFKTFCLT